MKNLKGFNENFKDKIRNVKQIDVWDWDKLVESTYGKIYTFQQQDGCKDRGVERFSVPVRYLNDYENDTIPEVINGQEMGVGFQAWLERDPNAPLNPTDEELKKCNYYYGNSKEAWKKDKSHIHLFWERNFYPDLSMIVDDLYKKGILEPGEYEIYIDW